MDISNATIDRHTPIIPRSTWGDISPLRERSHTMVKNRIVLNGLGDLIDPNNPHIGDHQVPGSEERHRAPKDVTPRVITDAMLDEALLALTDLYDELDGDLWDYLKQRGLTDFDVKDTMVCSTEKLVEKLGRDTASALTLRLPDKLLPFVSNTSMGLDIRGVSFPYWTPSGRLLGFITRVLDKPLVKYACSVPNRMCYGTDFTRNDSVWVVEGVFDAIAIKKHGLNPLGQGDSQPNYYRMLQASKFKEINLLPDNDYAGWLGAVKAYLVLTKLLDVDPMNINFRKLDDAYKDPGEACAAGGGFRHYKVTVRDAIDITRDMKNKQSEGS